MTRIGPYDLESELGRGGMGVVWLGRHRATGAARAVKVLDGGAGPEAIERFEREAEALARLGGRVAVPIHETGRDGARFFYGMAVMSGGSLRERIRAGGLRPWREATALAADLARALARVHAAGLVHRDLKPENVLFDEEGRAHLSDFGCARDLQAATITEAGALLGTPSYMAPEQLEGTRAGPPADVFALGAILFELLAGDRPFEATSWRERLARMRSGREAALARLAEQPPALRDLVARTLDPAPERRPDARTLALGLEGVLAGKTDPGADPRRARLAVAAGVVGAGLVAALALVSHGGRETAPSRATPSPGTTRPALASAAERRAAIRKRLETAPVTSASLPFDLVLGLAGDESEDGQRLLADVAARLVAYSPADTERLPVSTRPHDALAILRAMALLEAGTPEGRAQAHDTLRAAPPGLARQVGLGIEDVDRYLDHLTHERLGAFDTRASKIERSDHAGAALEPLARIAGQLAPRTVAALLAGVEPVARELWRTDFLVHGSGQNDHDHEFQCDMLVSGLARFPCAALPPALATVVEQLRALDRGRWDHQGLGDRIAILEAAGASLASSDPELAAGAWNLAARARFEVELLAHRHGAPAQHDPRVQGDADEALRLLDGAARLDPVASVLLRRDVCVRIVDDELWFLGTGSEEATRAHDRARLLECSKQALELHPVVGGVRYDADRDQDLRRRARALLESGQTVPHEIEAALGPAEPIRCEIGRRTRGAAAALSEVEQALAHADRGSDVVEHDLRNLAAVRVLALLDLGRVDEAQAELVRVRAHEVGGPALESLRTERLEAALEASGR